MAHSWISTETPMDIHENTWMSMEIDAHPLIFIEYPWVPMAMDIHRYRWISMEIHEYIHGYPLIYMDIHGKPMGIHKSIDIHRYMARTSMDIHGYPWISAWHGYPEID